MATIPFTEEDFESPMNAPPGQPPADIIDQMAQVREEQAKSLQEHIEYRAGLEEKQKEVELRSGDLDISERLLKVFDTTLPKPFREFELRGLSRYLGVDPKGDNFKEISKVVMGLDPDSSAAVKEAFVSRMSDASPGQVSEFTKGILTGKVPITQLAGMVREHQMAQAQTGTISEADAGVRGQVAAQHGSFKPGTMAKEASAQAGTEGARAGMAAGNIQDGIKGAFADGRESTNVTTQQQTPDIGPTTDPNKIVVEGPAPTDNRVVDPSMAAALGYDPNNTSSAEILARHPGIGGMGVKEQQEASKKLAEVRQYTQETGKLSDKINTIIDADPNTVPYTIPIIGKWVGTNLNAAKEITSVEDAVNAARAAFGADRLDRVSPEARETAKKSQELMNNLFALAYMSAKAKDPSGRLSDQDLQLELKGLGADTGSADLLRSALRAHVEATNSRYGTKIQTETGGPAVDLKATSATIQRQSSADPSGTPQQAQGTPAKPSEQAQAQQTPAETPAQQAQKSRSREEAKNADEEVQQAQRRFNLAQAPEEARLRLEAAQRDEVRLQLAMDAAKEAKEWKEYQKLKDQKAEARREKEKIQAAFAAFARALGVRGGVSMGGAPSMGPEQDASAFKIAPGSGAKRGPPTPGPAQSGYTYTRKRREMTGGG